MKRIAIALALGLGLTGAAQAGGTDHKCSIRTIAGSWVFATQTGHYTGLGDITAAGTMKIDRKGRVSGVFDFTVGQAIFRADNTYTGSVKVGSDCRGTLTFVDSAGGSRTDTIVIVDGGAEIWGMSQVPEVLWTYRVRRIDAR